MATKDISDNEVLSAYFLCHIQGKHKWPYEYLHKRTGQPEKVCYRAMERAERRGYIDYGVSLRSGWITDKGFDYITESLIKDGWTEESAVGQVNKIKDCIESAHKRFMANFMRTHQ